MSASWSESSTDEPQSQPLWVIPLKTLDAKKKKGRKREGRVTRRIKLKLNHDNNLRGRTQEKKS